MSGAKKVAAEVLSTYKNLLELRSEHKKNKHQAMLKQHPKYELFDFEHPYFDMTKTANSLVKQFEKTVKIAMDVEMDGSSLRREWEMIKVIAYLSSKPVDQDVTKLLKLK